MYTRVTILHVRKTLRLKLLDSVSNIKQTFCFLFFTSYLIIWYVKKTISTYCIMRIIIDLVIKYVYSHPRNNSYNFSSNWHILLLVVLLSEFWLVYGYCRCLPWNVIWKCFFVKTRHNDHNLFLQNSILMGIVHNQIAIFSQRPLLIKYKKIIPQNKWLFRLAILVARLF